MPAVRQFLRLSLCVIAGLPAAVWAAAGGLSVSDTRLVLDDGRTSTGIVFTNASAERFLTKTWIETLSGEETEDVMAVPPVAYCPPKKQVRFQVMMLHPENYPEDKESVFYFRTHSVPGDGEHGNALTIAYDMRLKVFYRPEGLEGDMASAIEDLKWRLRGGVLTAKNDSNFHVSLVTYGVNGDYTQVQDCVVAPGGEVSFRLQKRYPERVTVRWAAIDDYGSPMRVAAEVRNER